MTNIYLIENCYNDPNKVYIGKTKNNRLSNHKKTYGPQIIYNVIDSINSLDKKDWKPLECYWIHQFRQWGFEVLNVNEGGGGPSFQNPESNLKRSLKSIGKPKPWLLGRKQSIYQKQKTSQVNSIKVIELSLDICPKIIKIWNSIKGIEIARNINVSPIGECCRGKQKTCNGSRWMYYEEYLINPMKYYKYWFEDYVNQYDKNNNFIKTYTSSAHAVKENNFRLASDINACCRKEQKSAFGFKWKRYND